MKKVKHALFAFQPLDCEAARLWLTDLYEEGWELDRLPMLAFWPARFVPRTRDDLKYCVDLNTDPHVRESYIAPDDYRQLVLDSGWVLIGNCQGLNVYKSASGRDPAPIHTDPTLTRKRLWRLAVLPQLIAAAVLAALALLAHRLGTGPAALLSLLESNARLLGETAYLLLLLWSLYSALRALSFWRKGRGEERPPDVRAARVRARLAAAAQVLLVYLCIVLQLFQLLAPDGFPLDPDRLPPVALLRTEDVGLGETEYVKAHRRASLFLEKLDVELHATGSGTLEQTRYDCRWPWVADLAATSLLNTYRHYLDGLVPVELGFDGSWLAGQVLLLRQGNTVVLLSGNVDWAAPEYRPLLQALF